MRCRPRLSAFSLMELSVVLIIISLAISGLVDYLVDSGQEDKRIITKERLDKIEHALVNYYRVNGFLPCPARPYAAVGTINFGVAGVKTGNDCILNPTTDTLLHVGADATSRVAMGAVPTLLLELDDRDAFDGWGRRIDYHVSTAAINLLPGTELPDGAITVRDLANTNRTTTALIALVSHGGNGHGGYNISGAQLNTGVTTPAEVTNALTAYNAILFQSAPVESRNPATEFDDEVRYYNRFMIGIMVDRLTD